MKTHLILAFFFSLFCITIGIGCAVMGGDMPIRVSGSIRTQQSVDPSIACKIDLAQSATERIRSSRSISGDFQTSFVIEARERTYYFLVTCKNGVQFRSEDFNLGGHGSFNRSIDLGLLDMTAR